LLECIAVWLSLPAVLKIADWFLRQIHFVINALVS
jgi:hypothetical protein